MQTIFNRALNKHLMAFQETILKNESHTSSEMISSLKDFESKLQESFKTVLVESDKKLSESKNDLKKKNKAFNELKNSSEKKEFQLLKERDELQRELEKSKRKVH